MKIGIAGGIGSGKSYVCRLLEQRGISIYEVLKSTIATGLPKDSSASRLISGNVLSH